MEINIEMKDPNQEIKNYQVFTEVYKKYPTDKIKRELECLKVQFPSQIIEIEEHDLVAGRIVMPAIGFTPQSDSNSFGYFIDQAKVERLYKNPALTKESQLVLDKLKDFWETEDGRYKTRQQYSEEMRKILPSDNWNGESGIAFPLYRMAGTFLNIKKLVQLGLSGLKDEIQGKMKLKPESTDLYSGMMGMLDLVSEVCLKYADIAHQKQKGSNLKRKNELIQLEESLNYIARHKPETLQQAMQLGLIYTMFSGSFNFGRYDDIFGDFYLNDLKEGRTTEEDAVELVKSVFTVIDDRKNVYDSRVMVGGRGRENEASADAFALVLMEAQHQLKTVVPQFSLRFYNGQNPKLWEKALDMIGDGCTFPILYHDDINIPAVEHAFNLPYEEAFHYMPYGCGEYVINHRSVGTPSGVINLLQALLVTLHKGINPTTGEQMGLPGLESREFNSFEELWEAYTRQLEYHVDQLAAQEELEYKIAGEISPFLMFSILFDDCIDRGKSIYDGGIRYLGGTLETYGVTNTADSLTAIKRLIFDEQKMTIDELVEILDRDFEGFTEQLYWLKKAPKYGNDLDEADDMLLKVDNHIFELTRNQRLKTGLHSYLVVNINNEANTVMGRYTAAAPDGRPAFTFMANANTPSGGSDVNGITAMLNSIVKPDAKMHAGMVQNMKLSKGLFKEKRPMVDALLKTYFEIGGTQSMISVLAKDDLLMAMKQPEKYANLVVRVGGYSAKFVDLPRDIQEEILSRTLY